MRISRCLTIEPPPFSRLRLSHTQPLHSKRQTGLPAASKAIQPGTHNSTLSSKCDPAPKPESCSDPIGPFSHPVQTPVPLPTPFQLLKTHSAAIVTYCNSKLGWTILNFCFDFFRLRVSAGVHNRLAADAVNLIKQP